MLDGYENEYLGLLDRDADGMGVWKIGGSMPARNTTPRGPHPADTTAGFFLKLLDGDYGARVAEKEHLIIVVNAFWSGSGEKVGQPWELALRRRARDVLDVRRRCRGIRCTHTHKKLGKSRGHAGVAGRGGGGDAAGNAGGVATSSTRRGVGVVLNEAAGASPPTARSRRR